MFLAGALAICFFCSSRRRHTRSLRDWSSDVCSSDLARYPNTAVNASGWIRGEDLMVGRAAVVAVEMNPGKVVLFGIRPQHRAQTHATLPMLFNALYWSAE